MEYHHTIDVAEYKRDMIVKDSDFVPVCSNCHRMLHRTSKHLDIYQFKQLLKLNK